MHTTRQQRTIARTVAVEGFGYWSGRDVRVEFHPAEEHTGIVFVRVDLPGRPRIEGRMANRVETPRRTTLRVGEAGVDMIEHVMAALAGVQIDNCEIRVDQPEMPGCDGSSLPFVEKLDAAGIVRQAADRICRGPSGPLRVGSEEAWFEVRPPHAAELHLEYRLDYGEGNPIGRQTYSLALTPESFRRELAGCRTFMLRREADWLLSQGLGQRATPRDLLVFGDAGPIDNRLRFADECVRHKLLDMVGDLALAGCDLAGRFTAYRSGHRMNAELLGRLLKQEETRGEQRRCA